MSRSFRMWLAVLAVAFAACFAASWTQPAHIAAAPVPVDPSQLSFLALCDAYQRDHTDALRTELAKRHEFPPQDWQHVITGQVYVGMSRMGLVCARGFPQNTRSSTTVQGVTDWYSYTSPRLLVRLDAGLVHSFSN